MSDIEADRQNNSPTTNEEQIPSPSPSKNFENNEQKQLACDNSGSDAECDIANESDCLSQNDVDKVSPDANLTTSSSSAFNTNYDSSDGSVSYYNKCDQCDYEAGSLSSLEAHLRTHNVRRLFQCDVCTMKFSNGANMRRHRMRHTGVKPFECRICQKRFFRKDHLIEHQSTHSKTLPYHCPICNKGFQRQIAMRAHFQNEHVGQNEVIKSCPLCSFKAGNMKNLRTHFMKHHGIDLDNPATGTSSSNPQSPNNEMNTSSDHDISAPTNSLDKALSDTGPIVPPHFLTPQIEISTTGSYDHSPHSAFYNYPITSHFLAKESPDISLSPVHSSNHQSPPADANVPSSTNEKHRQDMDHNLLVHNVKQEPIEKDQHDESSNSGEHSNHQNHSLLQSTLQQAPDITLTESSPRERCSSSSVSLIKVSPLKSLLRDDLKRSHLRSRHPLSRPRNDCSPLESISSTNQESNFSVAAPIQKRMLQCAYCGIAFPDKTLYFLHKGFHSENNPWKCNICGEQCSNVYDFNSHLLSKTHE